jgi:hypothetical protein
MQSCPRCGAPTQPGDLACPNCNEPLSARLPSAAGLPSNLAPRANASALNSNGARPTPSVSSSSNHQASHETWGPGTWGPGSTQRGSSPVNDRYPVAPTPQPQPGWSFRAPQANPAIWPPQPGAPAWPAQPGPAAWPPQTNTPGYMGTPGYAGMPAPAWYAPGWYAYRPPQPPGESYRKVLSILALIASSLLILGGLVLLALMFLLALGGEGQDLAIYNILLMAALVAVPGGAACLYHSIRALRRHASAPFSLPSAWVWLGATAVAFTIGIALFLSGLPSGPLALVEPLVLLCGILPAFTILALTQQRLGQQTSWRRLILALVTGATLGVAVGLVVELGMVAQLVRLFHLNNLSTTEISSNQLSNQNYFLALFLLLAVGAPLAEETSKQIGGFFLLPRITSQSEAFLIGMAAGIGFNIVETSQYLGVAQADWIAIAIQRVGAGLIHGMGAAMAGLGWYYVFRGKTLSRRWKIALGCLAYAYLQHALLNGGELIVASQLPTLHVDMFGLRLDSGTFFALILYLAILVVLWRVTGWLRRTEPAGTSAAPPAGVALAVAGANGAAPVSNAPMRADATNTAPRIGLANETYHAAQPPAPQPPGQRVANPPGLPSAAAEQAPFPGSSEPRPAPTEGTNSDEQGGMQ